MEPDNKTKPISQEQLENHLPLGARLLMASIFLTSGVLKMTNWEFFLGYTESAGLPLASVALGVSVVVELVAGTMLIVGYRSRLAAAVLALYLVPTTFVFHQFWAVEPAQFSTELLNFAGNLAVVGGLLMVVGFGSGSVSVDSFRIRHKGEVES